MFISISAFTQDIHLKEEAVEETEAKQAYFLIGSAWALTTPSATTPSAGTGAAPSSDSKDTYILGPGPSSLVFIFRIRTSIFDLCAKFALSFTVMFAT